MSSEMLCLNVSKCLEKFYILNVIVVCWVAKPCCLVCGYESSEMLVDFFTTTTTCITIDNT